MALTRNFLKSMGLTDEQVNAVIEGHTDSITALTKERDEAKAAAEKVEELTRERDDYKEKLAKAGDAAKVQADFDAYKAGVEKDKLNDRKRKALNTVFEAGGVKRAAFRNTMLKAWDLDSIELNDDDSIKNVDAVNQAVQKDYADFIGTTTDHPAPPNNPPSGGKTTYTMDDINKMSVDEINKNWDAISKSLSNLK